jgi:hypothetical protein
MIKTKMKNIIISNMMRCKNKQSFFALHQIQNKIHKIDPSINIASITNTIYPNSKKKYIVGSFVEADDYDENIYNTYTTGIHYFKSKICALCYEQEYLEKLKYTGTYYSFDESGQKKEFGYYKNGKKTGEWILYDTYDFSCNTDPSFMQICKMSYIYLFDQQIKNIIYN